VCLLLVRGLPPLPWVNRYPGHWGWISLIFAIVGGFVTIIWDDEHPFRAFYFGLTWLPLLAALTR